MKGYAIVGSCVALFLLVFNNLAALPSMPSTPDELLWQYVGGVLLFTIVLIPIVSAIGLKVIRHRRPAFIKSPYSAMYYSSGLFVLMLCAWMGWEMSLHQSVDIRVDIFITIPAFLIQITLIAMSKLGFSATEEHNG